jgi:hypothetical protein
MRMFKRSVFLAMLVLLLAGTVFAEEGVTLTLAQPARPLAIMSNYPDGINITAKRDAVPRKGLKLRITVKGESDAKLYTDDTAPDRSVTVVTNSRGIATASLITYDRSKVVLQVTPFAGDKPLIDSVRIFTLTGKGRNATASVRTNRETRKAKTTKSSKKATAATIKREPRPRSAPAATVRTQQADETPQDQTDQDQSDQTGNDQTGEDQAGEDQAGEDQAGEDQAGEDQDDEEADEDQGDEDQADEDQAGEDQAGEDQAGEDQDTDAAPAADSEKVKLTLAAPAKPLLIQSNYPDIVKITAMKDDAPRADLKLRVTVKEGDAQLYTGDDPPAGAVTITTDAKGVATASLVTNAKSDVVLQVTPIDAEGKVLADSIALFTVTGEPIFVTSLLSNRSYLQLFFGQTFTNNYVDDLSPEDTQGENVSTGFGNAGPIVRLTFDTMWPRNKFTKAERAATTIDTASTTTREVASTTTTITKDGTKTVTSTDTTKSAQPPFDNRGHSMRHGLWHTDAYLEFSRFPFGPNAEAIGQENAQNTLGLKDAFSGSLGLTYQPNRFASYDSRLNLTLPAQDNQPYDAYRFGFFSKMGVTTRAKSEPGGNTSVNRIQFGIRFTHARSSYARPELEERNEIPIRFVEMSYARFSEWGRQDSASRLVIDAGLRITALSNAVFPVYVGGHLNMGPGEDDLRLFVGMLVKLDALGRLVQGFGDTTPK